MELVGGDLILRDDGPDVRVQLGQAWTATGPFATAATSDGRRLRVDVIFAETPHGSTSWRTRRSRSSTLAGRPSRCRPGHWPS